MFILLVILQVVVLNSISFSYAIPLVYIYFIIKLPVKINRNLLLLLGFITGFTIDIFTNTPGVNAAATTLIAFVRRPIMSAFVMLEDYIDDDPAIATFGMVTFMKYAILLVFIHMTCLVLLESFSVINIKLLLLRILFSTIISSIIIFGFEGFGLTNIKNSTSWRKN